MNIIFIAPPAAGKGTYSSLLKSKYGFYHVSPGALYREEVENKTEIGWEIESVMNKGALVDDTITKEIIEKKLKTFPQNASIILDGYPRTMNQIKGLEEIMNNVGMKIDKVIYLNISKSVGLKRKLSRVFCPKCKRGYNTESEELKSIVDGICDDCKVELTRRKDDTEEAYSSLYEIYTSETYPLIEYFKEKGILTEINGERTSEEVFKDIEKVLGVNNG